MEVGVNVAYLLTAYPTAGAAWTTHMDLMQAAGVKVARADFEWDRIEPAAPSSCVHAYTWTLYDAAVRELAKRGIRTYPIIDYSASWSGKTAGQTRTPPADPKEYARYAQRLVHRYGPNGVFWSLNPTIPYLPIKQWEIWNEPNGSYFWPPVMDWVAYGECYKAARNMIKGIDPTATVVVGGQIQHSADFFLASWFLADPSVQIDAVALHPYDFSASAIIGWVNVVRSRLDTSGRTTVPIEVTEWGATTEPTDPEYMSDSARAAMITATIPALAARSDVLRSFIYDWTSREQFSQGYDWWGLYHPDGSKTLSAQAFETAVAALG